LKFSEFLKQKLWPAARVDFFVEQYQKKLPMLRHILSATSFGFPHIIDADWRLDYFLKSDSISKVNQPQYYLKFKVKDEQGVPKDVEFVCSIEQLQDIVNKLQDAAHSINRLDLT
jgi:polycomb group RING finger protein 4